jgi:3-isopropylmalate/(R)-2-methylmalate dehydratase small subunit
MRETSAGKAFEINLEAQTINGSIPFDVSPRRKKMLLEGVDELGLTLALEPKIAAFQSADRAKRPWIYQA